MLSCRIKRLRTMLQREELDAFLVMGAVNLRYFCGFSGSDGALIVTAQQTIFLTDSRYTLQAHQQVQADAIVETAEKLICLTTQLDDLGVVTIGFESQIVSVDLLQRLQKAGRTLHFKAVADELSSIRQIKDETEIALLEHAARLNQAALAEVLPCLRAGISERAFALELEFALKRLGGERNAFDFIVASGQRGALPHGSASEKRLESGELVTIDFGTCYQGYHSDETVTLGVGEVASALRKVYDVVLQAHDLALAALEVSIPAREVDRIARQYIKQQGYGDFFGHGLGHGVGLEVHESPTLSPRSEVLLTAGMVFTIEPGIYIPGVGGVRIEDTVLLMDCGYRCLTQCPKQYRSIAA